MLVSPVRWSERPPARLVWARDQGYAIAKARLANGYVDRPLLPSEQARLIEHARRLALN